MSDFKAKMHQIRLRQRSPKPPSFLVFWSTYVRYRRKKFTFAISSPDEFLLQHGNTVNRLLQ